ncbi:acetyltransferase [Tsuneonella sp. HG249]
MSTEVRPLCCFGAGGHGRVVASQWRAATKGTVVFADEGLPKGTVLGNVPVLFGHLEEIVGHPVIVTVGDNARRRELQNEAEARGLELATLVTDEGRYFTEQPGAGSVVLAGSVVNSGAHIGRGVIVNSSAVVEHDCEVGDFAHISPGACLGGGCTIGENAWVGTNATIIPQLVIAPGTVIGAGSTVISSISARGVYVGSPARRIR